MHNNDPDDITEHAVTEPEPRAAALASLDARGAHFVLCGGATGKRPIWSRWQDRRPSLPVVQGYRDKLGVIPWSLRECVMDVDRGDPRSLQDRMPARVVLPTPRGSHWYFDVETPPRNQRFELGDVAGDILSDRKLAILHFDGPKRLADALARPGRYRWPVDLFEAAGILPASGTDTPEIDQRAFLEPLSVKAAPDLSGVPVGHRNVKLFNTVRVWAYRQWARWGPRSIALWNDHVRAYAEQCGAALPANEVADTALSISTWVASGHRATDLIQWTPEVRTARRRKGGIVRSRQRRATVLERDRAIVAMLDAGHSYRKIAAALKVSTRPVRTARRRLAVAEVEARSGRRWPLFEGVGV